MGGIGSGGSRRLRSKLTTADVPAVDIRELRRRNLLTPGSMHRCTATCGNHVSQVGLEVREHFILLTYAWTSIAGGPRVGRVVNSGIPFASTACNYGGARRWLRCPRCKRRASVIYYQSRLIACRRCNRLAYPSQNRSAGDRSRCRVQSLRLRLGGSANLSEPFPPKPRWMHWSTYDYLRGRAELDANRWHAHLGDLLDRRRPRHAG